MPPTRAALHGLSAELGAASRDCQVALLRHRGGRVESAASAPSPGWEAGAGALVGLLRASPHSLARIAAAAPTYSEGAALVRTALLSVLHPCSVGGAGKWRP